MPRGDQSRLTLVFERLLESSDSVQALSDASALGSDRSSALRLAAEQATAELARLQGSDQSKWNWGDLHALPLTHGTFGTSGITIVERLFNRGPYPTGGGSGVVNATGWSLDGDGYATTTVPSMRMVVDLSDWDASSWINLTGTSGHAFHPHYVDQAADWAEGTQRPWPYTPAAVEQATVDTLTLHPAQ